jgi:hypothetical protein
LAILEIYLRTKERGNAAVKSVMALTLTGLTFVMGFGIFAAAMVMWLPRL